MGQQTHDIARATSIRYRTHNIVTLSPNESWHIVTHCQAKIMSTIPATNKYKIVLLGEGRVGKTSLLLRYTSGQYNDREVSTIQASCMEKQIQLDGTTVALSIWDTAGQERFHALGPIYYRDADAALLVYDITDAESFTKAKTWVRELRKTLGNDIAIAIAGNKVDLEKDRHVRAADAEEYAASISALHAHTSAKANRGIPEVFTDLTRKAMELRRRKTGVGPTGGAAGTAATGSGGGGGSMNRSTSGRIVLVDGVPEPAKKKGCC